MISEENNTSEESRGRGRRVWLPKERGRRV